jgi:hypothetical protein
MFVTAGESGPLTSSRRRTMPMTRAVMVTTDRQPHPWRTRAVLLEPASRSCLTAPRPPAVAAARRNPLRWRRLSWWAETSTIAVGYLLSQAGWRPRMVPRG